MAKTSICRISDCSNHVLIKSRNLCRKHYLRFLRYGDPLGGSEFRATKKGEPLKWMSDHLGYQGHDCLIFPYGKHSAGYGALVDSGKRFLAHRWVCEKLHGPAPPHGYEVAHSCGNGHLGCVNPRHLRWANQLSNAADRDSHGRTRRGVKHIYAKLSEKSALEIYKSRWSGRTQLALAKQYGISKATVADIWSGRGWAWLTGEFAARSRRRAARRKARSRNARLSSDVQPA